MYGPKPDRGEKHMSYLINYPATKANIKNLMFEAGINMEDLAALLRRDEASGVYASLNPKNRRYPTVEALAQMTLIFDCKMNDLIVYFEDEDIETLAA